MSRYMRVGIQGHKIWKEHQKWGDEESSKESWLEHLHATPHPVQRRGAVTAPIWPGSPGLVASSLPPSLSFSVLLKAEVLSERGEPGVGCVLLIPPASHAAKKVLSSPDSPSGSSEN